MRAPSIFSVCILQSCSHSCTCLRIDLDTTTLLTTIIVRSSIYYLLQPSNNVSPVHTHPRWTSHDALTASLDVSLLPTALVSTPTLSPAISCSHHNHSIRHEDRNLQHHTHRQVFHSLRRPRCTVARRHLSLHETATRNPSFCLRAHLPGLFSQTHGCIEPSGWRAG